MQQLATSGKAFVAAPTASASMPGGIPGGRGRGLNFRQLEVYGSGFLGFRV